MKLSANVLAAIVGRRIRQARKAKDWTLEELANLTDMDRSTLSRLERGKCSLLCLSRVDAIASALEQDLSTLVTVRQLTASDLAVILSENPDLSIVLSTGKRREVLVDYRVEDDEIVLLGSC